VREEAGEEIYRGRRWRWMAGAGEVTLGVSRHLPAAESCTRALARARSEPGWRKTEESSVSLEPGQRRRFAFREPGWGGRPGYQTSEGCIPWAWSVGCRPPNMP
jgi:hypothetical protein